MCVAVQAHLKADNFYSVVANMRGSSPEEVAHKILSSEALRGLQVRVYAFIAGDHSFDYGVGRFSESGLCTLEQLWVLALLSNLVISTRVLISSVECFVIAK